MKFIDAVNLRDVILKLFKSGTNVQKCDRQVGTYIYLRTIEVSHIVTDKMFKEKILGSNIEKYQAHTHIQYQKVSKLYGIVV